MTSGDSAAQKAAAVRATAARYRIRADRAERRADYWERGAHGEGALAEIMAPLAADGYYHMNDRAFPGSRANLDHLLIGPAGIFVIDAKSWTGEIKIAGKSLRQNGRSRDKHLEFMRVQAVEVASILDEVIGNHRPPVRPVMCFVECDGIATPGSVDRVHLLNSSDLVPFVRSFPGDLDQGAIDDLMRGLLERLPARTKQAEVSSSVDANPPLWETVIFLQPWSKHGQRRLYVKTADGSDVGFLNLVTGQVHTAAEEWTPVLARLLPHYLNDGAASPQTEALSGEARSVFRRFLDTVLGRELRGKEPREPARPIVVAYHWRKFGKDRLYVHRIPETGLKHEIGWFDLVGRKTSTVGTDTPIVRYCGEQFRQVMSG